MKPLFVVACLMVSASANAASRFNEIASEFLCTGGYSNEIREVDRINGLLPKARMSKRQADILRGQADRLSESVLAGFKEAMTSGGVDLSEEIRGKSTAWFDGTARDMAALTKGRCGGSQSHIEATVLIRIVQRSGMAIAR